MIFKEPGKYSVAPYMSAKNYKKTLTSFVKYSVDIVFVDKNGNFLLGERRPNKAAAGTWFFGGQIPAFTAMKDQRKKIMKREVSLRLPNSRYIYLGQMRYWFNKTENGKIPQDALSEVFAVVLTKREIAKIKLDEEEYVVDSLRTYNLKQIRKIKIPLARRVLLETWKRYHNK